MSTKRFRIELPAEVLRRFGWKRTEVPHRVRETLVMDLLRLDKLSEAEAAEVLGLDRWELLEVMGRHRVPTVRMAPEELEDEFRDEHSRGDCQ